MTCAFAPPANGNFAADTMILDAARCWRDARDSGRPAQPALFETLNAYDRGALAPAFDSLMTLYESCSGRPFRADDGARTDISDDEHQLLDLLDGEDGSEGPLLSATVRPGLVPAMRIALHSTRMMLRNSC